MAVDRWFIGGGAEHTPEAARRALYASTSGAEGIGSPTDLQVRPLAVPGQGVRVSVGSALIQSRYVGGETQTYMGTVTSQETVSITPTGSGGGRTDLIVMQVEDPFTAGSTYSPPSTNNIPNSPYVYIRVISGVPAGTRRLQDVAAYANRTAITLARVTLPASTGTVTAGMITDLREVAMPKREEFVFARPRLASDSADRYLSKTFQSGGEYFPGGSGDPNEFQIVIPTWATRMVIDARWMGVSYASPRNPSARYWMEFGNEYRPNTWPTGHGNQQWEFSTQQFMFGSVRSSYNTDGAITDWALMDEVPVPAKLRGKNTTFVFKAGRHSAEATADAIWMDSLGGLGCRVTFAEKAIAPDMV